MESTGKEMNRIIHDNLSVLIDISADFNFQNYTSIQKESTMVDWNDLLHSWES